MKGAFLFSFKDNGRAGEARQRDVWFRHSGERRKTLSHRLRTFQSSPAVPAGDGGAAAAPLPNLLHLLSSSPPRAADLWAAAEKRHGDGNVHARGQGARGQRCRECRSDRR